MAPGEAPLPPEGTRPLGGGFGEAPVRVADLEAWARQAATRQPTDRPAGELTATDPQEG